MIRTFVVIFCLILSAPPLLQAETYRYTDDRGTMHFVDDPAKVPAKYRKKLRTMDDQPINLVDAPPAKPSRTTKPAKAEPVVAEQTHANVELYVTAWCGYCKKAIRYLNEKGIPYTAYDIEQDAAAKERHQALGGGGVPLIKIGDKVIRGFNPAAIDKYTGR